MIRFTRRAAVVALAALLPMGAALAQDVKERSIKFAFQNPKGHPQEMGAAKFAELVAAKSGGKLQVKLFPGGTLGGDVQTVSALQGGTVEMTVLNAGILGAQAKEFEIFDFPFLFANVQEVDAVTDGPFGQKLLGKLGDKGLVGLAYWDLGFRNVTNSKRPITKVEDIAGLKLRVIQSPIYIDMFTALGANATPMPFPEVYPALEQKAIDGQENPLSVIQANKFFEVQKYLTLTNHQYNPQSLIFSKKVWDTLSPAEKKILEESALEAAKFQRQVNRDAAAGQLDALKKAGMQVTELSAAEQGKLRDKMKPVIDKHGAEIAATVAELQAELAKLRK